MTGYGEATFRSDVLNLAIELRSVNNRYLKINAVALRSYLSQLRTLCAEADLPEGGQALLSQVLVLPGVVPEPASVSFRPEEEWPALEGVLEQGVAKLQAMRQEEGRAMAQEFVQHRDHIAGELERIRARIPQVGSGYR